MPPKGSKVVTTPKPEPAIARTPEDEEFLSKLRDFHEKRGTTLDTDPKVGTRYVNLRKLYDRVIGEGGYDINSDTKAKPLMWRKFAEEFVGKGPHLAAQAFQVKSAYYKNLVAYEIVNHWKREAPPKEILEDLTAKGGSVMDRTVETFQAPTTREESKLANGQDSDSDEDEDRTPKQEKMEVDEPGSAVGRSTRGLRQAPPQRVLFQPEVNPSRQTRNASTHLTSPSPGAPNVNGLSNASYLTNGTNTTLASYEPRQQYPLSLKPVVTPANNPQYYQQKRKQTQEAAGSHSTKRLKGLMLPGTGFIGPNIYVRAQLALQSGLPEEEQYALHHLVKISHERGDKYRFDQFPGLAEALINKVLQVSSLFYDMDWTVCYDQKQPSEDSCTLNGLYGTTDVLTKLKARLPQDTDDTIQVAEFTQALGRITEAGLVIRNMVMLDENAQYVAKIPLLKDFFSIVLNLKHPAVVELQHYALETAEQLTVYYNIGAKDPFYRALLAQLDGSDRGKIVTSLRTLARLGMRFQENKRLEDVPALALRNIREWIMVEDEELRSACLDFLFQFTSVSDNVQVLLREIDVPGLLALLSRLLLFNAKEDVRKTRVQVKVNDDPRPTHVPRLAKELIEQLLKHEEPERSSHWLRMCFQDDSSAEMTQIHLWQSYQGTFLPYAATHPHLIAGDFIKNVSGTFTGASAQVAGAGKYVIRGIRPRAVPVDYRGRELSQCHWRVSKDPVNQGYPSIFAYGDSKECGEYFPNGAAILEHVLATHLQIPRKRPTPPALIEDDGKPVRKSMTSSIRLFDFASAEPKRDYDCHWSTCTHSLATAQVSSPWVQRALMARHIETHMPDASSKASWRGRHNINLESSDKTSADARIWLNTMTDERNDAAGVPLGAALVMRNVARGVSRMAPATDSAESNGGATEERVTKTEKKTALLMKSLFDPIREKLFFAMAHNYVLKDYLGGLLKAIAQGGG